MRPRSDITARVSKLQGQLRGLGVMIEDQRDPTEIMTLIAAIRSALDGLGTVVLTRHFEEAIVEVRAGEESAPEKVDRVRKALARFRS